MIYASVVGTRAVLQRNDDALPTVEVVSRKRQLVLKVTEYALRVRHRVRGGVGRGVGGVAFGREAGRVLCRV